jgi:hypothetical protein
VGIDSVIDAVNSSIQERAGVAIEGGAWSTEELAQT